ncbi:hypothetical protein F4553_001276 [Allocatelliglobosispora scoriae]|uniref:Uncharacterized protein n=1 Tax=Allocatelliglobosispora scoriae TaxID=643052 RepID=A0A841BFN1_9ACTN|nr:hypothetical protein [Allocatelliglobosispora scoriae]MBB5867897.1 hypothetical protein [Allocatelliglobosispora scoriae]
MAITYQQLVREFVRLRHGRALQSPDLYGKLGPGLRSLFGLQPGGRSDSDVRDRLTSQLAVLITDFPDELRLAIRYALAIDAKKYTTLTGRVDMLAATLTCGVRTARRRVRDAFARLSEEACRREDLQRDPAKGWRVRQFRSELQLDEAARKLVERRTIVALQNNVERVSVRFSLPTVVGAAAPAVLHAEVTDGATLESSPDHGGEHFEFVLLLDRPLSLGEEHTFTMVLRVPPQQPIRDHYAFVPLVACETFHLTVRFDRRHRPAAVWLLDHLSPSELAGRWTGETTEPLDLADEYTREFTDLGQGFAYGLRWSFSDED